MDTNNIKKAIGEMEKVIRRELREAVRDIRLDSVYNYYLASKVFDSPSPLKAMTSWSIAPEFACWLFDFVIGSRPLKVLELGSGVSSLVIASALKHNGGGILYSFEHDYDYYLKSKELLAESGLNDYVELSFAPLIKTTIDGNEYSWYDLPFSALDKWIGESGLDLLVVDGPPASTSYHARYPAYPLLKKYLSKNSLVLLDDAQRREEKGILESWVSLDGGKGEVKFLQDIRHVPALFFPYLGKTKSNIGIEKKASSVWVLSSRLKGCVTRFNDSFVADDKFEDTLHELTKEVVSIVAESNAESRHLLSIQEAEAKNLKTQIIRLEESAAQQTDELRRLQQMASKVEELELLKTKLREESTERQKLAGQLKNALIREKEIKATLSFQIGVSIVRSFKNPAAMMKLPLALYRVCVRYKKSKQLAVSNAKKIKATSIPFAKNDTKNTLFNSFELSKRQGWDAAIKYAEKEADNYEKPAIHLLRANKNIGDDDLWLNELNYYIRKINKDETIPLKLKALPGGKFKRLSSVSSVECKDGVLVSIIMPAYNCSETLSLAIDSILNQTWKNLELIVVDDCSSDDTLEIAKSYADKDSRVSIIINSENVGPYVSKNIALAYCNGAYITGHDADDWAHPQRIENQVKYATSKDSPASLIRMLRMGHSGEITTFSKQSSITPDGCRRTAYISCFFDSKFLKENLGGWDTVRFGADSEIIKRSELLIGHPLDVLDEVLMLCLDSEAGLTRHPEYGTPLGSRNGLSPVRKEYVATWTKWHNQTDPQSRRMPFPHNGELYQVPLSMKVNEASLRIVLQEHAKAIRKPQQKILFIYNDSFMKKVCSGEVSDFSLKFFESDQWPARPNSTSRLNICNYQAARKAFDKGLYDVTHVYAENFDESIVKKADKADFVVVHQVASNKSRAFVRGFTEHYMKNDFSFKLIFGTEMTWGREFEEGNFSSEVIKFVYNDNLLLRHTPKTDRFFYNKVDCLSGSVQEFELGIDTDLLSFGSPVDERKYIAFVKAPEGRKTKNNKLIDELIERVAQNDVLSSYEIVVMEPPYSSVEYWNTMAKTAFLIMTSDSETFSYVVNDARALGVITFHPAHMYSCDLGSFVVDSYPDSPHMFSCKEQLIKSLEEIAKSRRSLLVESVRSREFVLRNFSLHKLAENWLGLIEGRLNKNVLFVVNGENSYKSLRDFEGKCKDVGASHVLLYSDDFNFSDRNSFYDDDSGITYIRHFLERRGDVIKNGRDSTLIGSDSGFEIKAFFSVIRRIYKIEKIIYESEQGHVFGYGEVV
ncbi:glycosyltransferase [Pseudomonas luteola]|uniref:glycosyltransferase n=1 Tax=Pseudomonas luteola TaxID=47886 RepID=UPI000F776888|nr:glycosyltransferase [Pseudomonas luteola]RRW46124.1 glycosyltransferase [Pseudomonas luteola]